MDLILFLGEKKLLLIALRSDDADATDIDLFW